jgi:hypothetical protein
MNVGVFGLHSNDMERLCTTLHSNDKGNSDAVNNGSVFVLLNDRASLATYCSMMGVAGATLHSNVIVFCTCI